MTDTAKPRTIEEERAAYIALRERYAAEGRCVWEGFMGGYCGKPVSARGLCAEHAAERCDSCAEPATGMCHGYVGSFGCGSPLCDNCVGLTHDGPKEGWHVRRINPDQGPLPGWRIFEHDGKRYMAAIDTLSGCLERGERMTFVCDGPDFHHPVRHHTAEADLADLVAKGHGDKRLWLVGAYLRCEKCRSPRGQKALRTAGVLPEPVSAA